MKSDQSPILYVKSLIIRSPIFVLFNKKHFEFAENFMKTNIQRRDLTLLLCKCPTKCHSTSSGSCSKIREKLQKLHFHFKSRIEREGDLRSFVEDLMNVVFAEASVAGVVNLADERDWLRLRHRHDPNQLRVATRPLRRITDPRHYRPERRHGRSFHRRSSHVQAMG